LPARDESSVNGLPKRLAEEGPFNGAGINQIKNGSQWTCEVETGSCLHITHG
jgi:hypothetical protein